jgi:hypothetical protein
LRRAKKAFLVTSGPFRRVGIPPKAITTPLLRREADHRTIDDRFQYRVGSQDGDVPPGLPAQQPSAASRLRVRFTTAAALVHELMEARDEKRLLRFQEHLLRQELLIVDELGFVPLSKTGAEMLFEVFSQRYERVRRW